MADKAKQTKIDPELTRQLDEADAGDRTVQAVVYLRNPQRSINPDSVTKTAKRVIDSASTKAGTSPARVNVMRYIGTVAVEAPASFVRALIEETEVASALANVHPGDDDPGLGKPSPAAEESERAATGGTTIHKKTRSRKPPPERSDAEADKPEA
jgi:hypothetical protein